MNKVQVRLSCRHLVRVSLPRKQDREAYCSAHGWQRVTVVFESECHAFCVDCPSGKWFGQSPSAAESFVQRHRENNPGHRVTFAWDEITKDGRGTAKREYRSELATAAKVWENGPVTAIQDVIPF